MTSILNFEERFPVRAGFSLGCFSQGKVTAFPCVRALLALVLYLRLHLRSTLGTTTSFLTERRVGSGWRLLPWVISPLRSFCGYFRHGRTTVASAIGDSRCGKGGGFFSPRRLAVSRARDGKDASGHTWHSASHTTPLTSGQPLYIDKAIALQTRLTFARAYVMVSSDKEPPNEDFYRDLDGSTRKVKVSYSWKT
ncbi:hypothetical protein B296_00042950 [Ensete ventricosum]|uniref:Uncharacterized protein n=1 Tax=Ensete ventricosum TaxID=4639 RepID=A0A426XBT5_ENSVE|nr:hypothetical protein B296_00042950 [Ensete ventricosum]